MTAGYLSDIYDTDLKKVEVDRSIRPLDEHHEHRDLDTDIMCRGSTNSLDYVDNLLNALTFGKSKLEIEKLVSSLDLPDESVLPSVVKRIHGCLNCEWRGTKKCPYWSSPSKKRPRVMPGRGICQKRLVWLRFLTPGFSERPTLERWTESFLKNKAIVENMKDLTRLEKLQLKMDEVEGEWLANDMVDEGESEIKRQILNERRAEVKKEWIELYKLLLKSEQSTVERETPKKMEVEHKRSIPLSQMQSIMRGDYVDAEIVDTAEKSNASSDESKEVGEDD